MRMIEIRDTTPPASVDFIGHDLARLFDEGVNGDSDAVVNLSLEDAHGVFLLARLGMGAIACNDAKLCQGAKEMPEPIKQTRKRDAVALSALAAELAEASKGSLNYTPADLPPS